MTGLATVAPEQPTGPRVLGGRTPAARHVSGMHRLLQLDPDLGRLLDADRYAHALAELRVRGYRRDRGPWEIKALASKASTQHLGLLIVDGVIASDTRLEDVVSTELLGAGDILRPWPLDASERLLPDQAQVTVLADCRVAVLDPRLAGALGRYPEIYAVLMERMDQRTRRLATTQAIAELNRVDRRLLTMLWHLAERWGRMTANGVLIPLDISHRLLAQLVGARRPSVSTALGVLARDGAVHRRPDGAWVLHGEPPATLATGASLLSRRRLFVEQRESYEPSEPVATDVHEIEFRLRRLRREADALQAELAQRHAALTESPHASPVGL